MVLPGNTSPVAASAKRKAYLNVVLPLFITSIIAYLDRVNLGYAALTMKADLQFSNEVFGLGAGIFFVGYFLCEIPGALIAERFSAKWWLARIMITWGIASGLMAFTTVAWQFYLLRFLLGVAEASLYPVLYATCIPRWFSAADRPGSRHHADLVADLQRDRGALGRMAAGSITLGIPRLADPVSGRGRTGHRVRFCSRALGGRLAARCVVADRRGKGVSHAPIRKRSSGQVGRTTLLRMAGAPRSGGSETVRDVLPLDHGLLGVWITGCQPPFKKQQAGQIWLWAG